VYLTVALVAVVAFAFVPDVSWLPTAWQVGVGYGAAAAVVVGVRRHRPAAAASWYWLAVGIAANTSGIVIETVIQHVDGEVPLPSLADIGYLGMYPALCLGLALFVRRRSRSRNWPTLVETCTISTGLGLLSWVYLIRPPADDPALTVPGRIISIGYPVGDLILLAMTLRLVLGGRARARACLLIAAGLTVFLGGDVGWAVINKLSWAPTTPVQDLLASAFLLGYVLLGYAALHPSMAALDEEAPGPRPALTGPMLALLASASLIAPALLAYELSRGEVTDGAAIVFGSVTLFLLVLTRMAQLVRHITAQAAQLRELSRVDDLTGLPNRRAWSSELPAAIERARRDSTSLSIAMLDLDHFKRFNDQFGHPAGDRLLKSAAVAWSSQLRAVDQLARYGGEEFILLLPGAGPVLARHVLDRLAEVTPAGQTFSAGVASWNGQETSDELVSRADRLLYGAKQAGRNRVHADSVALQTSA
jgi:diguanylate cyclase (GGDEF)-like protein